MKELYIEECLAGEFIDYLNEYYIITSDFKKNNARMCIKIKDGTSRWLNPDIIVKKQDLYSIDKDNNFFPIKEEPNVQIAVKNQDFH